MAEGMGSASVWARGGGTHHCCLHGAPRCLLSKRGCGQPGEKAPEGEHRGWGHEKQKPEGLRSPVPARQALLCDEMQPSALADGAQSLQGFYSCLPPATTRKREMTVPCHRLFIIARPAPSAVDTSGVDPSIPVSPLPRQQAAAKPGVVQPLPPGMSAQKSRSTPGYFLSILLTIKQNRKKIFCLAKAEGRMG